MKRRTFLLGLPIATAVFAMAARAGGTKAASSQRAGRGFRVEAQKDRYKEELLIMGGRFDLKVSSRDSGGDLCIYDTVRQSKGGPGNFGIYPAKTPVCANTLPLYPCG